jgi:phage terminase small subunit
MAAARPLTPTDRELAFLAEYLANGRNATRAYLAVWPNASALTARTRAAKVLAKPHLRTRLRRMERELRRKVGVEAERVLAELAAVAFSDVGEVIDLASFGLRKRISPAARRAIASIKVRTDTRKHAKGTTVRQTVEVRFHSKAEALEKIARHLGLFDELPPLEMVLALLPSALAEAVRAELVEVLPDGLGKFTTPTADPIGEPGDAADEILTDATDDAEA